MSTPSKIGIAGFGMEGRAAYDYFSGTAEIHIFDEEPLVVEGATVHQGLSIPADIEVVYKSPGIPTHKIQRASSKTRITTFMDLMLSQVGSRAIGVTGTKGKSTVTSLIYHVLHSLGRDVVLFGNIGIADAATLRADVPGREYVLELSSYQCEHLSHSPHIAVLTNLFQEHLSHHGSFDQYKNAKLNIARFHRPEDVFVDGVGVGTLSAGTVVTPDLSRTFDVPLLGAHNQRNCALAYEALRACNVSDDDIRRHFKTFVALPYRLERIKEVNGITFYDDSLATVPEATLASLSALPQVDTLILGGQDRGISFTEFADALSQTKVSTFIIFPTTGKAMVTKVSDRRIVEVSDMASAVRAAYAHTAPGGVVLLSNASPSFNLFKDYKDKSAQYRAAVDSEKPPAV